MRKTIFSRIVRFETGIIAGYSLVNVVVAIVVTHNCNRNRYRRCCRRRCRRRRCRRRHHYRRRRRRRWCRRCKLDLFDVSSVSHEQADARQRWLSSPILLYELFTSCLYVNAFRTHRLLRANAINVMVAKTKQRCLLTCGKTGKQLDLPQSGKFASRRAKQNENSDRERPRRPTVAPWRPPGCPSAAQRRSVAYPLPPAACPLDAGLLLPISCRSRLSRQT